MNNRCFALRKNDGCGALNVDSCLGREACVFYKQRHEHERDLKAVNVRLNALPEEIQLEIAEKYHGGRMPWKGVRI